MTKTDLRKLWLQVHKWIGICLAIVFVPLSFSGSMLVWHETLDAAINPQREIAGDGHASLTASAYVYAAQKHMDSGHQISSIRFEDGHAVMVTATDMKLPEESYRPLNRTNMWLDPADGRLLDKRGRSSGFVPTMEQLHGSLFIPMYGRPIIGFIGLAMLVSSLSGLWLWWPVSGSFSKGLKWRRSGDTYGNVHHMAGFWVCAPLAMLSLTGAWIAFPEISAKLSGTTAPSLADRMIRMRTRPLPTTNLDVDSVVAKAMAKQPGPLAVITWPTERDSAWRVAVQSTGKSAQVSVDDKTGEASVGGGNRPGRIGQTLRRMHDGSEMGAIWQGMIFLAGLLPTILGVTGLVMWWRSRGWRADLKRRTKAPRAQM